MAYDPTIAELQTKLAFQEDTIERLNEALTDQQKQIHDLQFQMQHVVNKMKQVSVSDMATDAEETPPPHY